MQECERLLSYGSYYVTLRKDISYLNSELWNASLFDKV